MIPIKISLRAGRHYRVIDTGALGACPKSSHELSFRIRTRETLTVGIGSRLAFWGGHDGWHGTDIPVYAGRP